MRNIYELYIGNQLCDLLRDESVSLVYQSGLFSELDAIQSNRSHTINLPLTAHNLSIFGMAQRPDVDSDAPYKKHSASLYQDGIALFVDGYAVITEITDEAISVVLTWGNVENFEPLFDANLRDLGEVLKGMPRGYGNCAHIDWNENSDVPVPRTTPLQKVGFYGVDFGMGISTPQYVHPSVTVAAVVEAIEKYHGITIDGKERLSPDLIMPCVSRNADEVSNAAEYSITTLYAYQSKPDTPYISTPVNFSKAIEDKISSTLDNRGVFNGESLNTRGSKQITIEISGSPLDIYFGAFQLQFMYYGSASSVDEDRTGASSLYIMSDNNDILYSDASLTDTCRGKSCVSTFAPIRVMIDTEKYNNIKILIQGPYQYKSEGYSPNVYIKIKGQWDDVVYPSVFPIAPNLPDMSHGAFITALLSLNGLFAYIDNAAPNTIKLMSAEDITSNLRSGNVVDWSSRVLVNARRRPDMPDSTQYAIDDYARRNSLDYDNDDEVQANTVGYINIDNRTLDKETEMVLLDFSASDNTTLGNGMTVARIEAYEEQERSSAGEVKVNYSEPSPRILSVVYDEWYMSYGQFTREQYFGGEQGIVATKYASLQRLLERFRLITVRLRLTALDLCNLDYRVPVYLSQFGQNFAIYKIEMQANSVCECMLLQLPFKTQYYLTITGHSSDFSQVVPSPTSIVDVDFSISTSGTPYVVSYTTSNAYLSSNLKTLTVHVGPNTTNAEQRFSVVVALQEDPSIKITITIIRYAA